MKPTPRTDSFVKGLTRQKPAIKRIQIVNFARGLERELDSMTENYVNTRNQLEKRIESNESAMKTCASLAAENDRLRGDLEAAMNSYHAANNERLALKGVTAETKHPNNQVSDGGPLTHESTRSVIPPFAAPSC